MIKPLVNDQYIIYVCFVKVVIWSVKKHKNAIMLKTIFFKKINDLLSSESTCVNDLQSGDSSGLS